MEFNQLIVADSNTITESEKKFLETHSAILTSGSILAESAVSLAANLKKMRDEKLYIEAGFETFADYTEKAIGLKQSQAYKYIKVLENFSEGFFHSSGKLGITKLNLLASLTNEEREKIEANVDVEEISVSELKEKIKQLEEEKEKTSSQLALALDKKEEAIFDLDKQETIINNLKDTIFNLEQEVKKLKTKPAQKEIVKEVVKEKIIKDEKTEQELKVVTASLKMQGDLISEKEQEIIRLKKQLETSNNEALLKFKIKFEEFQKLSQELILHLNAIEPEKQSKCKEALKAVLGGLAI